MIKPSISERWYVLQVLVGKEKAVESIASKFDFQDLSVFLPQKKLKVRRKGRTEEVISPLYPGYVFVVGKWNLDEAKQILKCPGTVKFIGGINSPGSLELEEIKLIKLITPDGVAEYSQVVNEGSKIKVISGPLKELEGTIVSVDRRKKRAIVKLPLLNTSVKVTLGFEFFQPDEKN